MPREDSRPTEDNARRPVSPRPAPCALLLLVSLALGVSAAAQGMPHYPTPDQPLGTPRLEFDIVSVKPAPPGQRDGGVQPTPGYQGYTLDNTPLFTDMTVAYGVVANQIEGGPSWIRADRWDIEAKSDQPHTIDDLHLMLEHALEDRFALKLHHETRQESVLSLEVDSKGARLTTHEPANDTHTPPLGIVPADRPGVLELQGTNGSMSYLAFFCSRVQQLPVLDRTELSGHYDISVEFTLPPRPEGGAAGTPQPPDLSPLFDAMRDQLGLRLVRGSKGAVDHIVIDSVHRPTGN
ncbi:MAG TPA: TIGR03435 family protein [Terriglobales bacterium]|nr:TIGR03435 family protein [Terriglobales bacterium]